MMLWFALGTMLLLGVVLYVLVRARRHWDMDPFWYGLVVVGAGAGMAGLVVNMGVWIVYHRIFQIPPMDSEVLNARWDVLFVVVFLRGPILEACKAYGHRLFHGRMTRGSWVLHGAAVGAGAGWIQAFWFLGATLWSLWSGETEGGSEHLWLLFRCASWIALEAVLTASVTFEAARGFPGRRLAVSALLHGLALFLPSVLISKGGYPTLSLWGEAVFSWAVALGVGGRLWRIIRRDGWPV